MAAETRALTHTETQTLDAYWRAANYLSVGQIYLMANPLLAEPRRPAPRSVPWSSPHGRTSR